MGRWEGGRKGQRMSGYGRQEQGGEEKGQMQKRMDTERSRAETQNISLAARFAVRIESYQRASTGLCTQREGLSLFTKAKISWYLQATRLYSGY